MAHNHSHHDPQHKLEQASDYLNRAFKLGIGLNIGFALIELGAGFALNSMALISDAGHNISDVIALALAMFAFKLAEQKPTQKYTYGRKKGTVIASLANACILLVAIGIILYESIGKIFNPVEVQGGYVAIVAGIGIVINGFTAWLFMRHRHTDLNVKGAYLHMLADTLVSVGVVISGLIIKFTGWYILDPIIGIMIVVVIFLSTWGLLRDSIRLSLDGVPPGMDLQEIKDKIAGYDNRIINTHHIHIWALSTTETALTAHIVVNDLEETPELKHKIKELLKKEGIAHATLEFESLEEFQEGECKDCKTVSQ